MRQGLWIAVDVFVGRTAMSGRSGLWDTVVPSPDRLRVSGCSSCLLFPSQCLVVFMAHEQLERNSRFVGVGVATSRLKTFTLALFSPLLWLAWFYFHVSECACFQNDLHRAMQRTQSALSQQLLILSATVLCLFLTR